MKISKTKLRRMILKDSLQVLNEADTKKKSEMKQFVESRGGRKMEGAGRKISSAASVISELAGDQTGTMRDTLYGISEFVEKVGASLSGMNMLQEGESAADQLPSNKELHTARILLANSPEFRSSPEHGAVDDVLNRIGNAMMWLTGY
jgi:hypothetical protein